MAGVNVQSLIDEFMNADLDPAKIGITKVYNDYSALSDSVDMSTMAHVRNANAAVGALFSIIGSKEAMCCYYQGILKSHLEKLRLSVKYKIMQDKNIDPMTATTKILTVIDELVDRDESIIVLSDKLATVSSSKIFWQTLTSKLSDLAKRIDSAGASLGLEAKVLGISHEPKNE